MTANQFHGRSFLLRDEGRRSSETMRRPDGERGNVRQPDFHVDAARAAPQFDTVVMGPMFEHVAGRFDGILIFPALDHLVRSDSAGRIQKKAPVLDHVPHSEPLAASNQGTALAPGTEDSRIAFRQRQ